MSTYSDDEIEGIVSQLDELEASITTDGMRPFHALDNARTALRQLLSEVRKLREELEPCPHEEVEEAGAIWWRCYQCGAYIERNQHPEPSEIPPGVGQ